MTFKRITLATLAASLSLVTAAVSAEAQESTARFSTTQTGCKVWNPQPASNETVYWSGDCVNGYGEGKGIIVYGVVKNSRAELSMSDTNLKNGKQHGYGIAHFSSGSKSKRYYQNGTFIRNVSNTEYANNTLINYASAESMKTIIEEAGFTYESSAMNGNRPYIEFKDKEDILHSAYATACNDSGNNCLGIYFAASFDTNGPADVNKINELNNKYAVGSAFIGINNPNSYSFSSYVILDNGRSLENLSTVVKTYVAVTQNIHDKMNEN